MRAYTPPVRRALLALLVTSSLAAGEDWDARCREAAAGTPPARRVAIEELRRGGPEAGEALARAAGSADPDLASLAELLLAARRWDPDARMADIEPLRLLDRAPRAGVMDAVTAFGNAGACRCGAVVARILEARPRDERPALLSILSRSPARDPGWAEVATAMLTDDSPETRRAALGVIRIHGNWHHGAALRAEIARETDAETAALAWTTLVDIARGPEDLPPLPEDPILYHAVLGMMAGNGERPRMVRRAWEAWGRRPGSAAPATFAYDPPRLVRLAGMPALERAVEASDGVGELGPGEMQALARSGKAPLRGAAHYHGADSANTFVRLGALLEDPDERVRNRAQEVLADTFEIWSDQSHEDQREKFRRLSLAVRMALDIPLGISTAGETAWAVRVILEAGKAVGPMARLAVTLLSEMGADGFDALLELEQDPDLGAAASNARRAIALGLDGNGLDFEEGLDSRPWLDWFPTRIDWNPWRPFAESPDEEDRWFAASLLTNVWDLLEHREETRRIARRLLEDGNADISSAARQFLLWRHSVDLPEEDTLRPGEAWVRERGYVLERLRASADALAPLDADTARAIFDRGDRALVLKASHAGRFASDDLRDLIRAAGEPGLLPILLRELSEGSVTNWPVWSAQMASCGADGCRLLAAVARTADSQVRAAAIGALLANPWGFEAAALPLEELSALEGEEWEAALFGAMAAGGLAWREDPLPRRTADAIARAILRLADLTVAGDRALPLVRTLGRKSLRDASPALLLDLSSRPALAEAAVASRAWIGPVRGLHERAFRAASWMRGTATDLLPGNHLELVRCAVLAWVESGSWRELPEPYRIGSSWQEIVVALLDEAARNEEHREAILDAVGRVRQYAYDQAPAAAVPSVRFSPAPPPPSFEGRSEQERAEDASLFAGNPDTFTFERLCSAAFRGATGDEIALDAVAPRLGPDALPQLVPLLGRRDSRLRMTAASAIARAAGPARGFALAALRGALPGETDAPARIRILAALARLDDAGAIAEVRSAAASPDPDTRLAATRALAFCPTRAAASILASLTDDPDAAVRLEAYQELSVMTQRVNIPAAPPFTRAAEWRAWLDANPAAPLADPPALEPQQGIWYEF